MRILIVCAAIFLVCGAVGEEENPGHPEAKPDPANINGQSQGSVQKSQQLEGNAQAAESTLKSTESTQAKVEKAPEKTDMKVQEPISRQDVSDLLGENVFSRAAYLLTGISVLVLMYFAWKSFSLRRRQTHIHKYGVVASREDLEMTSLGFGSEDEDDDTTHFDIGKHQRS